LRIRGRVACSAGIRPARTRLDRGGLSYGS
jgi:hypothetical protein